MNEIPFPPRSWVRALYACKGTGLPRIAEFIRKIQAKRHPKTEVVIDDFGGGARFICCLGEHMGSQIYWRGAYSGSQLRVLASRLREGAVFIDLGANQGEFTVFAARLVGKEGRVFAFEPSPTIRQRLSKNVQLNDFDNVIIEPFAVAENPGQMSLYEPTAELADGLVHAGLHTLYLQPGTGNTSKVEVDVITLDGWVKKRNLERVDVIKMDIEGAELPALRGSLELIRRFRPELIIELNDATYAAAGYSMQDLVTWLEDQGYDIYQIDDASVRPLNRKQLADFQNILATPRS